MPSANPFETSTNPILVEVIRGEMVESVHRGSVVIVDHRGVVADFWGRVDEVVYPRSALKPIQAIPLLESGAFDHFGLSAREIALACASHEGEPLHVEIVGHWLARIGLSVEDLRCGLPECARHARGDEEAPIATAAMHQCSGNHVGFLTTARFLGEPTLGYVGAAHPVQRRVFSVLEELAGIKVRSAPKGTDGCGIPVIGISLKSLATAIARLGNPVDLPERRAVAAKRIVEAMHREPYLVAGKGRSCTALMQRAKKPLMVKMGAEGVYVAAIPDLGLGVAIKIDDGSTRAAEVTIAAVLNRLGVLNPGGEFDVNSDVIFNRSGVAVGLIHSTLETPAGARRLALPI
jgi:L-asparaginase II